MVSYPDNVRRGALTSNGDGDSIGRRELMLIESGLKRWPTTPEMRAKLTAQLEKLLGLPLTPTELARVGRVLAAIEKQNQDDAHFLLGKANAVPETIQEAARELRLEFDS